MATEERTVLRPAELAFERDEFARRLHAVRRGMEGRGIDVLLLSTPENVTYLTGYETIGYSSYLCLVVPASGDLSMVVREMELDVARGTTWLEDFSTVSDGDDAIARTCDALKNVTGANGVIGIEQTAPFFTVERWRALVDAIGSDRVANGSGIVEPVRRVKSDAEIAYIREACKLAGVGMRAAVEAARPGATENDISVAAYAAMVAGGSDFLATDPIVTSGPRSTIAHTTFGGRQLAKNDQVLVELGACKRRYFGALMRTVPTGEPNVPFHDLEKILNEALDECIAAVKPGVAASVVDAACRTVIVDGGYGDYFRKRTGYSIGVAFAPDWGEGHLVSLAEKDHTLLEPGMVFHIPPAVRIPGATVFGTSETVLVTPEGHEVLTSYPRDPRE
jgi:Xaa-Pro dipeptidase